MPSFLERGSYHSMSSVDEHVASFADPMVKLVNKTSIKKTETSNCLCTLGSFWHWRIHSCVKQGAWGYECGFFPEEHHHRVCLDGLKCDPTKGAEDRYHSAGNANTFPASCIQCMPEDNCK